MVATKDYRVREAGLNMTTGTPAATQRGLGLLERLSGRFRSRFASAHTDALDAPTAAEHEGLDQFDADRRSGEAELWLGRWMRLS
jgi:hypothetical protein